MLMGSPKAFWQQCLIKDSFLALGTTPSLAGFLFHTHIRAETKSAAQRAPTSAAAVMKGQPLPCLWSKNEAAIAAESDICSPLLRNMNTDITILQAKGIFCAVEFLVLPFGAKDNSWKWPSRSGLSSPGKLQCKWCSKANTLQAQVKQYITSKITHILTNTGNFQNF